MNRASRLFAMLALVACVYTCTGCSSKVQTSGIRDVTQRVLERHDAYVVADDGLDSSTRAPALGQSSQVRAALEADEVAAKEIEPALLPVLDRHDRYIDADGSLEGVEKRTAKRSSRILRSVLDEAKR